LREVERRLAILAAIAVYLSSARRVRRRTGVPRVSMWRIAARLDVARWGSGEEEV